MIPNLQPTSVYHALPGSSIRSLHLLLALVIALQADGVGKGRRSAFGRCMTTAKDVLVGCLVCGAPREKAHNSER